MKESPILYSTPMVLSLLAGLKTKTRRMTGLEAFTGDLKSWITNGKTYLNAKGKTVVKFVYGGPFPEEMEIFEPVCRFGNVGDRLWVREAWQPRGYWMDDSPEFLISYPADNGQLYDCFEDFDRQEKYDDMLDREIEKKGIILNEDGHWDGDGCPLQVRPGIHLWKEFSRIWLEITDIKVERLLSISEEDAIAEGVEILQQDPLLYKSYLKSGVCELSAVNSFNTLWFSIHKSFNNNPWVWVITFKVLSTTGKADIPADQEAAAV